MKPPSFCVDALVNRRVSLASTAYPVRLVGLYIFHFAGCFFVLSRGGSTTHSGNGVNESDWLQAQLKDLAYMRLERLKKHKLELERGTRRLGAGAWLATLF